MRTAVAVVALLAIGGTALGEITPLSPAADVKKGVSETQAGADNNGKKMRPPNGPTKPADATESPDLLDTLTSCLELWEPATHMTRREWAFAWCRRAAEICHTAIKPAGRAWAESSDL